MEQTSKYKQQSDCKQTLKGKKQVCRDQHFKEYAVQQAEAIGLQQGFQTERVEQDRYKEEKIDGSILCLNIHTDGEAGISLYICFIKDDITKNIFTIHTK